MKGQREAPRETRKKLRNRTKFTFFAMFNLFWYTIAVLVANFLDHTVAPELTVAWFSAWTVELAILAGFKITDKSDSGEAQG